MYKLEKLDAQSIKLKKSEHQEIRPQMKTVWHLELLHTKLHSCRPLLKNTQVAGIFTQTN